MGTLSRLAPSNNPRGLMVSHGPLFRSLKYSEISISVFSVAIC